MKYVLVTKDADIEAAARQGFMPDDEVLVFAEWKPALEVCAGAELLFVDMLATLLEPHKVEGYEQFALAKMAHPIARNVRLVLISPGADYDLDFMVGWPDFLYLHYQRPVTFREFRRATTY